MSFKINYVSQEEVESSNSSWKFGINKNVLLKKMEFHKKTNKEDGGETPAKMVFFFGFEDSDDAKDMKKLFIMEPSDKIQYKGNEQITSDHPDFKEAYNKKMMQMTRTVISIIECFMSPNEVRELMSKNSIETFEDFYKFTENTIKSSPNFKEKKLDLFLQWSKRLFNDSSYLEIPMNVNQGLIVTEHKSGDYRDDIVEGKHLRYILYENDIPTNKMHPIRRGEFFMKSDNSHKITIKKAAKAAQGGTSQNTSSAAESEISKDWASILD